MTTLKTVDEVASSATSAVGWTDTENAIKYAEKIITQDRQSHCDELVRKVKEIKEFMAIASSPEFEMGYQMAIKDYEERALIIVKEVYKSK